MMKPNLNLRILVRGSNDVGSAVAHRLFESGYAVVIHDIPLPSATRRKMAYTDAVFEGHAMLEGLDAHLIDEAFLLEGLLRAHETIPITTMGMDELAAALQPAVLVDARMRKRAQPEDQRGLAVLCIGLGPNFVAGENVHLAIETGRG